MRLAHLGPAGTFGESAAVAWAPNAELLALASHARVADAVQRGEADAGVLAIENSLEGAVNETLDLLIHDTELSIAAEIVVSVEHCLLGQAGAVTTAVNVVYSHPQALAQCRKYLERELPDARLEASLSTVAGVERALGEEGALAIGSARAAERLGAEILARGIQDRGDNVTRFVVVAHADSAPTGRDKTSLAFKTAHDQPGTLVEVLGELSRRDVNLTKIESRPSRDALGVYVFLVDLEGHRLDAAVSAAIAGVRGKTSWLKIFGSYPRG
ncbi:MAG: prephenate dehydratase [Myxococcales bacterium]|nr:prephenate dehydratase [Myxococcales bacterium]